MNAELKKLMDFHQAFDVTIEKAPVIPSENRCQLRQKLLEEELMELKEAWQSGEIVQVADALADLQYVLLGTVLEFGLQDHFSNIFNEVHKSNMSKLDKNGMPVHREDGKVIKSDQFKPPQIQKIINP